MDASRGVLLTGVTGFIGGELLARLLDRDPERRIYCLIRASSPEQLEARRRSVLAHAGIDGPAGERVVALAGDVVRPDLGLGASAPEIAEAVSEIYHVAASTKFDLDLESARAINRDGARHIRDFAALAAERGGVRRLHHVSTAYVVGDCEGEVFEGDAESPSRFRNTYEQTKWEGEQVLSPESSPVPVTCYRPSIVVGDSRTGRTLHFRVLYDPMRWIYSGKMQLLPCRPEVRLDVVPVDWVCDAMLALGEQDDSAGQVYHLSSGAAGAMRIDEIIDVSVAAVNAYHEEVGMDAIPRPTVVSPELPDTATDEERQQSEKLFELARGVMGTHVPYMLTDQVFDGSRTRDALAAPELRCPPLRDYLHRIVRWGVERGFSTA